EVSGDNVSHVAAISSGESEIGELLAKAFDTVGVNGVITVEESSTTDTELEITEGMEFDKGYLSPYMVTDAERQEAVLEDPYILLTQSKISNVQEFLPLLSQVLLVKQQASAIAVRPCCRTSLP